ncbi:hypothetical protein BST61_g4901 [Cercospora zeina]
MALQVAKTGGLLQRDIPPATTSPSVEKHALQTRIRTLVALWEHLTSAKDPPSYASSGRQHVAIKDLWKPRKTAAEEVGALPKYEECVSDLPPDYSATGCFAYARCMQDLEVATNGVTTRTQRDTSGQLLGQACDVKVDFNCEHGYRVHAKKKKPAAKAAPKSKWDESDNEEKKEEAPAGGDDNGAGGGGDGAGGAGDPPGGNGGGDDGEEWNTGGGKKNRKDKKKQAEDEEEQDNAAEEESPPAATGTASAEADALDDWGTFATVGKKNKPKKSAFAWDEPEPEAPVEPVADPHPAAAETPAEDAWGSFATVGRKGKKSKKTAVPEPVIEPEQPPEPPIPEPATAEDEWASFGKKDKKKKKGKNEPAPETTTTDKSDMKFDDINLDDDKGAPKLDLDFGLGKNDAPAEEKTASSFSFGGWGGGWKSGSTWGFGSSAGKAEADPVPEEDTKMQTTKMDTGWGFTSTSKSKKNDKKPTNASDFSFDDPAGDDADLGAAKAPTEEKAAEEDPWSSSMSAKDKKKLKKKGVLAPEATTEPEAPQPVQEPVKTEDDPWASFTSGKKDKKSKLKKGALPDPEPVVVVPEPKPEPKIQPVTEKVADDDSWSSFTSAKDKKGEKKGSKVPDAPPATFDWSEEPIVEVPAPQEATAAGDADWFGDAWSTSKKSKKQLTATVPEPELQPEAIVEPTTAADDDWSNSWSTGTKKKSSKKTDKSKGIIEVVDPSPGASVLLPESVQEKSAEDDPWGSAWTTGKKTKSKVKKGMAEPPPPAALPALPGLDYIAADEGNAGADLLDMNDAPADDLWSFTAATTKKKNKGAKESPIVEAPLSKSNTKDSKTSSKSPADDFLDIVGEAEPEPPKEDAKPTKEDKVSSSWGIWGVSTKKETPKEKKAREKREKEEREAAEAAEAQRIADEEAEAQRIADEEAEAQRIADEAAAEEAKRLAEEQAAKAKPKLKETTKERKAREKREKEEREAAEAAEAQRIADEAAEAQRVADEEAEAQRIADEAAAEEVKRLAEEQAAKAKPKLKETTKERKAREKREKEEREAAEAAEAQRIADEAAEAQRVADEEAEAQRIADEAAAEEAKRLAEEQAAKAKPKIKETTKERKAREKREAAAAEAAAAEAAEAAAAEAEAQKNAEQDAFEAVFGDDAESKPLEEPAAKADGWSFWGSSLKSSKKATPAAEMNKDWTTNQELAVDDASKKPDILLETDDLTSAMPPLKAAVKSSKSKIVKGSSVRDRISALGAEALPTAKASSKSKVDSFPAPPEPELAPELEVEPVVEIVPESAPLKKSKRTDKTDKKSKTLKDPSPPPPPSISPVPGGFPVDDLLEDIVPQPEIPVPPPKNSSKEKKSTSKSAKASKQKDEPVVVSPPPPEAEFDEVLVDAPAELQSPTPEETPKERKSSKKDRPKVLRDDKSASWGFWGATPVKKSGKKTSDSKDSATPTKPSERPSGLSRSKSARKPTERDALDKDSKSSESETPQKQSKSRPSTSRGMSFGGLFGAPPPTRTKSTKIPSSAAKPSSRRHSTAVEEIGLMSPPPEMSAKAAKVTGVSRSKSTREKKTRMIPDPYPIDSDDMIMVDAPEDSAKEIDDPRDRKKSSRSRRHHMSGGLGEKDEEMMDAPRGPEEARVFSGTDDVERPAPPRRSSTMKKAGLMGGILGAFGAASRPAADRRPSKYDSEDAGGSRRKRDAMHEDDGSKRLRREDRRSQTKRQTRPENLEGVSAGSGAPGRRPKRPRGVHAVRSVAAPRRKRKKIARSARMKKGVQGGVLVVRKRKDWLVKKSKPVQSAMNAGASVPQKILLARTLGRRRIDDAPRTWTHPKTKKLEGYGARNAACAAAWMLAQVHREGTRTSLALCAVTPNTPKIAMTGGDKTSSWVHSVNDDPPPPPPIEGTIIDAPVHFAADNAPDALDENETTAREFRHRRERRRERDDGYGYDQDDDYQRHRRRPERSEGLKSSSGEGSSGRRKSHAAAYGGDMYGGGMRTFDGRPSMPQRSDSKKGSWFKKIAGLQ